MANEKFELNFISDGTGKKIINEPGGYNSLDLNLNQKDKLYGRDISFSSGEFMLKFFSYRDHCLEKLLYYHQYFGFEAIAELIITPEIGEPYIGELDFPRAKTNGFDYIEFPIIQKSSLQIIKRRKSVKIDLLSNKDVDGNTIAPLVPQNTLLRSKPVIQNSEYSLPEIFNYNFRAYGSREPSNTIYYQFNPFVNIVKYGFEDTLTFFSNVDTKLNSDFEDSNFKILKVKNNQKNTEIKIETLTIDFNTDTDNGGNGYVDFELVLKYGQDFQNATKIVLLSESKNEDESYYFQGDVSHTIGNLQREDNVWLYFFMKVRQSAGGLGVGEPRFETFTSIKTGSIKVRTESTSYNSITPSLRLVDVMRQIIKSISGLDIVAPRFEALGEFYDNRLFNGNFLRNIKDNPFNISLEDLEKSFPEFNADYEITSDGKIFFGIEKDFYRNEEMVFFDNTQFSDMTIEFNQKFTVNEFYYNYKKYQSLKENEEIGSADTVHGESRFVFVNKNVENKKEVSIEWTRDAFLIEEVRRKAILLTEQTASQDDDSLFIIDTINITQNLTFDETSELQHEYQESTGNLLLRNRGDINFIALGIEVGQSFFIYAPDPNTGLYGVVSVSNSTVELIKSVGTVSPNNGGVRTTKYYYVIDNDIVPYENYTNQGFTQITNLNAPNQYSNLRYSVRRNIQNYWKQYLATVNLYNTIYNRKKPVLNNWYKNNGECTTTYNNLTIKEKSDLDTQRVLPLLSPFMYQDMIFANVDLADYKALETKIRSVRGYIKCIDNNDRIIKVFPKALKYDILKKELNVLGEEKFEPVDMSINTVELAGFAIINKETYIQDGWTEGVNWIIQDDKLFLFDNQRQRLYNGVYHNRVAINGSKTDDMEELRYRLSLI